MKKQQPVARVWNDRDTALWHTCEIAADLANGISPPPRQQVMAPFPPQLHADERFWASGLFDLFDHRAVGDGTYTHNGGFFFATGPAGLAMTGAALALRAAGNSRRRSEAQHAATPRWVPIDSGSLYVSEYGYHLQTPHAVLTWNWESITAAEMVGPAAMHLLGNSTTGPVSHVLRSDWAELVFVTWALRRHRQHPQLLTGTWLPPGWLQWCATQTHRTRLTSPALPA